MTHGDPWEYEYMNQQEAVQYDRDVKELREKLADALASKEQTETVLRYDRDLMQQRINELTIHLEEADEYTARWKSMARKLAAEISPFAFAHSLGAEPCVCHICVAVREFDTEMKKG